MWNRLRVFTNITYGQLLDQSRNFLTEDIAHVFFVALGVLVQDSGRVTPSVVGLTDFWNQGLYLRSEVFSVSGKWLVCHAQFWAMQYLQRPVRQQLDQVEYLRKKSKLLDSVSDICALCRFIVGL